MLRRQSLRWRLPLLIAALIALTLLGFLWAAYRTVEMTLVAAGGERAQGVAEQVATLLSTLQTNTALDRVANEDAMRRLLRERTDAARDSAQARLQAVSGSRPRRYEIWDDGGTRLLELSQPSAPTDGTAPKALPQGSPPESAGTSVLHTANGVVFSDFVADIRASDAVSGQPDPGHLGYLMLRSTFSVNPPGIIDRLVGQDGTVAVGNRSGGVWTNFATVVSAPLINPARAGVQQYQDPDGQWHVGAAAPVRLTPWVVWAEFPRAKLVAPAQVFMRQIVVITLLLVTGGAVLVWILASRITRPLSELNNAAVAIAGGDYSRRLSTNRRDEIGTLAGAFNSMTRQIQEAHERLEGRVIERTAQLATARQEADRANGAKSEFLSLMSHDLRTPLNAILGFAQLLEIDELKPDQADHVRQILSGGRHLLDLISDVLDITRVESGQLSFSPEPVLVRDAVQRAVDLVKPLAAKSNITLAIQSFADSTVKADRQRLSQILLNLLSNGVKYNRRGGKVTVSGERVASDRYRITVADTGAGIPASKVLLLFQPFERLGAEQTAVEGTGLGLALSRALAEAMGGTLGVDSVIDEGSAFWLELPALDAQTVATAPARPAESTAEGEHAHTGLVLYVEDNVSNVQLMERILRHRPGVELLHTANGSDALTMVKMRRPHLVLLDMHLPDISGEEVLDQLWADPDCRRVPIVVVTADATPGLARRLQAAGATACVTKPLNIKAVLALIDQVLTAGSR